jgi:hypothetical protein
VNDFNFEPVAPAVEIHGYGNPAGNDWVPILPSSGPISQPHSESYVTGPSTVDRLNPDSPEIDPEHVANLLKAALAAIDRSLVHPSHEAIHQRTHGLHYECAWEATSLAKWR